MILLLFENCYYVDMEMVFSTNSSVCVVGAAGGGRGKGRGRVTLKKGGAVLLPLPDT